MQNGVLWDGVKRDRLVWAGDMYVEILTCLYLYALFFALARIFFAFLSSSPRAFLMSIIVFRVWRKIASTA